MIIKILQKFVNDGKRQQTNKTNHSGSGQNQKHSITIHLFGKKYTVKNGKCFLFD